MIHDYELVIICKPDSDEVARVNSIREAIATVTTKPDEVYYEDIGVKHLAYDVKTYSEGHYYYFLFTSPDEAIISLRGILNKNKDILKFMEFAIEPDKDCIADMVARDNTWRLFNLHKVNSLHDEPIDALAVLLGLEKIPEERRKK